MSESENILEATETVASVKGESFLIRTVGGPMAGTRVTSSDVMPWPLPAELPDPEGLGRYVKRTESQMPPQPPESHFMRGAEYFWEGREEGAVLCGAIGCSNVATHTWSGHPTCDACGLPGRALTQPTLSAPPSSDPSGGGV